VKSSIAGILLLSISGLYATEPTVSIYPVSDSLFVAEDSHYAKTNYAVYPGHGIGDGRRRGMVS